MVLLYFSEYAKNAIEGARPAFSLPNKADTDERSKKMKKLPPDWLTMVHVRNIKLIQKDCIRFMRQVLCASDRLSYAR